MPKSKTSLLHIRKHTFTHFHSPPPERHENATKGIKKHKPLRKEIKTTCQNRQRTSQRDSNDSKRYYRGKRILPRVTLTRPGNVM